MRRTFLGICLSAMVMAVAASGCGGSDASTAAGNPAAPQPPEKITKGMEEHKKLMLSQRGRRPGGPPARAGRPNYPPR
jgi:hypothetical protein